MKAINVVNAILGIGAVSAQTLTHVPTFSNTTVASCDPVTITSTQSVPLPSAFSFVATDGVTSWLNNITPPASITSFVVETSSVTVQATVTSNIVSTVTETTLLTMFTTSVIDITSTIYVTLPAASVTSQTAPVSSAASSITSAVSQPPTTASQAPSTFRKTLTSTDYITITLSSEQRATIPIQTIASTSTTVIAQTLVSTQITTMTVQIDESSVATITSTLSVFDPVGQVSTSVLGSSSVSATLPATETITTALTSLVSSFTTYSPITNVSTILSAGQQANSSAMLSATAFSMHSAYNTSTKSSYFAGRPSFLAGSVYATYTGSTSMPTGFVSVLNNTIGVPSNAATNVAITASISTDVASSFSSLFTGATTLTRVTATPVTSFILPSLTATAVASDTTADDSSTSTNVATSTSPIGEVPAVSSTAASHGPLLSVSISASLGLLNHDDNSASPAPTSGIEPVGSAADASMTTREPPSSTPSVATDVPLLSLSIGLLNHPGNSATPKPTSDVLTSTITGASDSRTAVTSAPSMPASTDAAQHGLQVTAGIDFPPLKARAVSNACGETGNFTLDFDDLPSFSTTDPYLPLSDAPPLPIPYHHFWFSNNFVYAPLPSEPFAPVSGSHLLVFLPKDDVGVAASQEPPAEFSVGPKSGNSSFWFDAYSMFLGCDDQGSDACVIEITGYTTGNLSSSQAQSSVQVAVLQSCSTLAATSCKLAQVVLDPPMRALSGISINAYTSGGVASVLYMDNVNLGWTDNSCQAGLQRESTR